MEPKYKRILLKLSGEALAGDKKFGLNYDVITDICKSIKKCVDLGVQIGIVVGGGNFWRGRESGGMDRTRADHMGMLATTINALGIADVLESLGVEVRVQTAITMQQVAEPYIRNRAIFSTDTAAALRAVEIEAEVFFKATMVDGVYDKDPHRYPDAVKYETLTYSEVLAKGLAVMDSTAATLCKDNGMSMLVFNMERPDNIYDAIMGQDVGTLIKEN